MYGSLKKNIFLTLNKAFEQCALSEERGVFNVVGDDQSASTKHNGCAKKTSPSYKQFILESDHFHTVDPHSRIY